MSHSNAALKNLDLASCKAQLIGLRDKGAVTFGTAKGILSAIKAAEQVLEQDDSMPRDAVSVRDNLDEIFQRWMNINQVTNGRTPHTYKVKVKKVLDVFIAYAQGDTKPLEAFKKTSTERSGFKRPGANGAGSYTNTEHPSPTTEEEVREAISQLPQIMAPADGVTIDNSDFRFVAKELEADASSLGKVCSLLAMAAFGRDVQGALAFSQGVMKLLPEQTEA